MSTARLEDTTNLNALPVPCPTQVFKTRSKCEHVSKVRASKGLVLGAFFGPPGGPFWDNFGTSFGHRFGTSLGTFLAPVSSPDLVPCVCLCVCLCLSVSACLPFSVSIVLVCRWLALSESVLRGCLGLRSLVGSCAFVCGCLCLSALVCGCVVARQRWGNLFHALGRPRKFQRASRSFIKAGLGNQRQMRAYV